METGRRQSYEEHENKASAPHLLGELVTGRSAHHSANGGQCWNVCFSPDQEKLAWNAGFGELVVLPWKLYRTCLEEKRGLDAVFASQVLIKCHLNITSVAFGSSQELIGPYSRGPYTDLLLATGHDNGRVRIWDPNTGELVLELSDHRRSVRCLAFSTHNSLLVSGSDDGTIKVWDLADGGNMVKTLKEHRDAVRGLAWAPNDNVLCSVGNKQKAVLWDMKKLALSSRLSGHYNDVLDCCFSPDGALIATASADTRVIVWCAATGTKLHELNHEYPTPGIIYMSGSNTMNVTGVSFPNNCSEVATICTDGKIRLWDLRSETVTSTVEGLEKAPKDDMMLCCQYSPDGESLAVGYASGNALIYDTYTMVPTLLELSRMAVRRNSPNFSSYDEFNLPPMLDHYLMYRI